MVEGEVEVDRELLMRIRQHNLLELLSSSFSNHIIININLNR
jgi:hypothetical protein